MNQKFQTLFPYDKPRPSQVDGMKTVYEAAENEGFLSMEGACGTGKTLAALVPYLRYVRNQDTPVERVLAVTSVKQQMPAFQDEIERINNQLPDKTRNVSAVSLVGLPDVHPFVEENVVTENPYSRIDSLREGTRELTNEIYDYSFSELVSEAKSGDKYAYANEIPELSGVEYDPYYARYRSEIESTDEEEIDKILPFNPESVGLLRPEDIREICAKNGVCPHSIMRLSIEYVDVVLGNYNHIFEPRTAEQFTASILNDETVVVLDEAHNLVPRVRRFLSDSVSVQSLIRAANEAREIGLLAKLNDRSADTVRSAARAGLRGDSQIGTDQDVVDEISEVFRQPGTQVETIDDIVENRNDAQEFIMKASEVVEDVELSADMLFKWAEFLDEFADRISKHIEENANLDADSEKIPLRDPEEPQADGLSQWVALSEVGSTSYMSAGESIGGVISKVRNEIAAENEDIQTNATAVGSLLHDWYTKDNIRYFRSIEINERHKINDNLVYDWQNGHTAHITLNNCIPRDEISDILSQFHSGVLMSATLEPLDIYKYTTGLSILEQNGREIYERTYGLAFPQENRKTLGVKSDKFKYSNRGSAYSYGSPNLNNDAREQYEQLLLDIGVNTDGNLLVVMPSYKEAEWAGDILKRSYEYDEEDIYVDESSSNEETQELKQDFFNSDNAVLITGARGTLIEGVDYIGDRLSGVVVCGVPITDTNSDYKRAIEAAYDELFVTDETPWNGFNLAFTIPAVRKARQALGRVIRTNEDRGVRILADKRYCDLGLWDGVNQYLSEDEQEELKTTSVDNVASEVSEFF